MNKKPTILAVAALGSLALIGTGFAGWVIAADAKTSAEGTITAYTVTDNRLEIATAAWDDEKGDIKFAKPKTPSSYSNPWFTFNGTDTEKLTATYNVTVKSKNAEDSGQVKATATVTIPEGDGKKAWTEAVGAHYVVEPTVDIKLGDKKAAEGGDNIVPAGMNYSFVVNFGWGDHFKIDGTNKNPYDFYNSSTIAEKGDDAATAMGVIAKIGITTFTLNITFARVN